MIVGSDCSQATWWVTRDHSERWPPALRAGKSPLRACSKKWAPSRTSLESSGLAISRTQPACSGSHNDSGDGPSLYAIDISGKLLGTVPVANAMARDWEDISAGPCPAEMANDRAAEERDASTSPTPVTTIRSAAEVTIYIVVEPRVGDAGAQGGPLRPVVALSLSRQAD